MKSSIAEMARDGGNGEYTKLAVGITYEVSIGDEFKFKGTVMGYNSEPEPSVIIFEDGSSPNEPGKPKNLRMVNANFITKLTFVANQEGATLDTENCVADLSELQEREALAVRGIARIGVGVTREAQSIFDALCRMLHVEWDKTDIIAMKEVRIRSPYLTNCVTGEKPGYVKRVKEVLKEVLSGLQQ